MFIQLQYIHKAFLQSFQEGQRTTQEHHLALQFPPLCQTADGLVHYRMKNTGCHILFPRALI